MRDIYYLDTLKKMESEMDKAIIGRLEYVEETYAGEAETWEDPVTGYYYHVPIEIVRDFDAAHKCDKP